MTCKLQHKVGWPAQPPEAFKPQQEPRLTRGYAHWARRWQWQQHALQNTQAVLWAPQAPLEATALLAAL